MSERPDPRLGAGTQPEAGMPKASNVLILVGGSLVAAFVGHFWGGWAVLLAVGLVFLAIGVAAYRNDQ